MATPSDFDPSMPAQVASMSDLVSQLLDENSEPFFVSEKRRPLGLRHVLHKTDDELVAVSLATEGAQERYRTAHRSRMTEWGIGDLAVDGHIEILKQVNLRLGGAPHLEAGIAGDLYLVDNGTIAAALECQVTTEDPLSEHSKECLIFARQLGLEQPWTDFLYDVRDDKPVRVTHVLDGIHEQILHSYLSQFVGSPPTPS